MIRVYVQRANGRKSKLTEKTFILIAMASCAWIVASLAATIPAGTTLVVQTIDAISSRAVIGRTFTARLALGC
jgi:hypothetical protein